MKNPLLKPGTRINHLKILRQAESRGGRRYYWCECACGNRVTILGSSLKHGPIGTQSCNVRKCPFQPLANKTPNRKPRPVKPQPPAPVYDRENDIFHPPGTILPPRLTYQQREKRRQAAEMAKLDAEIAARQSERRERAAAQAIIDAAQREADQKREEFFKARWIEEERKDEELEELRRDPLFDDL